jgi:hypothetical protein
MIKNIRQIVLVSISILFAGANAFAVPGMNVGLMVGPNLSVISGDFPVGTSISGGIGYSVGPSVGLGPIEVSALYTSLTTKATVLTVESSSTTKYLEIPVLYRLGLGPVGLGLGGFYGLSLEDNATSDSNNYGLTASGRVTVPGLGLFVDGRFNLGLNDMSGSKISSAAVLIGYDFL